ncbi:helix-turn-helix domain-containing protein [Ornithinibacillus bavariensis]|uniref:ImmA/IrrE family metallo-endopeptidase n=1 Tax=Ornithinibacillus bavariensis TaxID=545502 RepID=A0A919X7E8_9BACI|nr:XRE family transcriptional regulator [Ornithinibacillus bavariensis]GIO25503.1 ImmA/IrrE family metallo-endopeptidase [Ornithinibacillus bavariensis]HAM80607.1 transcriptional regulator [Ornithinibacillus sp.]
MFKGNSLTNIRILHGLSRKQLADRIGVTEQAIWQYENGYVSPKLEVVNRLKVIFNVKSSYFYHDDILSSYNKDNILIENIAYRSSTINSLQKTQSESMHIRFIDSFLKKVETRISYPMNILLELRNYTINYLKQNPDMNKDSLIKHVADYSRKKIGMDSNSNNNFLFLLERAGAFVFEKEIGDSIDAYSLWSEDNRAYIVLGTVKKSAVRRNFDLAHELGHLLLHYKVEFSIQDKKDYRALEDEANQFASEFLLPEYQFSLDCENIGKKSNPDAYIELKEKWLVSLQAMAARAFKLGIIDYQQYRYFYMLVNKKGYKQVEPLDNRIPIERPSKVKSILQLLFDKEFYTVTEIMDELRINQGFLTILTGLEEEFFTKNRQREDNSSTVNELIFKTN